MTKYAEIIKKLSCSELNTLFLDIKHLWEKGQFPEGKHAFGAFLDRIKEEITPSFSMHTLERDILFEIALRSFPLKEE